MKFCINCPNSFQIPAISQPWQATLTGHEIAKAVERADALGYHTVNIGEHFIVPDAHFSLSGGHYLHGTVALGFLAGHTKRIRLASAVTLLPLQHPIVQAKAWATLDWLSGGRAAPIFGVGWLKEEFDYLNVDFHARGKISDEYIASMIALWEQERPEFSGIRVAFKNVHAAPRPLQRPFPIWFGGDAEPVLKRVARFGLGWSPLHTPPEDFPDCLDIIHSQPDYNGRPTELYYALETLSLGPQHVALKDDRANGLWNAQQIIDQCGWLARLGVTATNLPLPILRDYSQYLDQIHWVAEEIFPAFSNAV